MEVSATASTLGAGVEIKHALGANFAARVRLNGGKVSAPDVGSNNIDYKGDLKVSAGGVVLDYHPGGHWFRLSGGVFLNGTKVNVDGKPSGGNFTFNGTTYTAAEIGSVKGKVQFDRVAPYVGIGLSRTPDLAPGVSISADLGALLVGQPKSSLDVSCGAAVPLVTCSQLQSDADIERRKFEHDAHRYSVYPVISVGLGYRW